MGFIGELVNQLLPLLVITASFQEQPIDVGPIGWLFLNLLTHQSSVDDFELKGQLVDR